MTYILSNKKQLVSIVLSVVLSFLFISMIASAVTYINTASVGIATATPGAMLAVQGRAIIDGGVWTDYITATSTSVAMGFGTTSPGAEFAVDGGALFGGGMTVSYLKSTSTVTSSFGGNLGIGAATTSPGLMFEVAGYGNVKGDFNIAGTSTLSSLIATSTVQIGTSTVTGAQLSVSGSGYLTGGLGVGATASSSGSFIAKGSLGLGLLVDGASGAVAIGTTTIPGRNDQGTAFSPSLTVSAAATSTMFLASEGSAGGQIILKATNGNMCVSITYTATVAVDASNPPGLTVKVIGCPF